MLQLNTTPPNDKPKSHQCGKLPTFEEKVNMLVTQEMGTCLKIIQNHVTTHPEIIDLEIMPEEIKDVQDSIKREPESKKSILRSFIGGILIDNVEVVQSASTHVVAAHLSEKNNASGNLLDVATNAIINLLEPEIVDLLGELFVAKFNDHLTKLIEQK